MTHKPDNWTGKTWALQQGYLQSSGSILLFTDADTYYSSKDTILLTISYMQIQNLDVLSGMPSIDLRFLVKDYNTSMGFSICSLWRKHS